MALICVLIARSNAGCLPHTSATATRVFCCLLAEHRCSATQETPARCTHWEMTAVHSFSFLKMLLTLAFEAPFPNYRASLLERSCEFRHCVVCVAHCGGIAPLFDPTLVKPHTRRNLQLSLSRPKTQHNSLIAQFLVVASLLSVCRFGTYRQYPEDMCDNCPSTIVGVFFFQSQLSVITFVIVSLSVFATFFLLLTRHSRSIHRVVLARCCAV